LVVAAAGLAATSRGGTSRLRTNTNARRAAATAGRKTAQAKHERQHAQTQFRTHIHPHPRRPGRRRATTFRVCHAPFSVPDPASVIRPLSAHPQTSSEPALQAGAALEWEAAPRFARQRKFRPGQPCKLASGERPPRRASAAARARWRRAPWRATRLLPRARAASTTIATRGDVRSSSEGSQSGRSVSRARR
jgi:hypothetical protein